jgi:hypothetical protein
MAMNRGQFQKGLSLPDFIQRSGTEEQCATALESAHRPDGFHCLAEPGDFLFFWSLPKVVNPTPSMSISAHDEGRNFTPSLVIP